MDVKEMEKYISYEYPESEQKYEPWNMMNFYECKVLNLEVVQYEKAGKRMSIEIEAPKFRKKFFLFAWEDQGVFEAIEKSGLKIGDYISCHAELSYYQNKEGRYCDCYKIIPDQAFDKRVKENPRYFKLMRIKREFKKETTTHSGHLSKDALLKLIIGQ